MNPDLQITTTVSKTLYEHLNATSYLLFQKKKTLIYCSACTFFLFVYYAIVFGVTEDKTILYFMGPACLCFLLFLFYYRCSTKLVARRYAKRAMKRTRNQNAHIRYTFYPDFIEIESENQGMQTKYTEISMLAETSLYYFLFTNKRNAHTIKKSNLGQDNVEVFKKYMEAKSGRNFVSVKY